MFCEILNEFLMKIISPRNVHKSLGKSQIRKTQFRLWETTYNMHLLNVSHAEKCEVNVESSIDSRLDKNIRLSMRDSTGQNLTLAVAGEENRGRNLRFCFSRGQLSNTSSKNVTVILILACSTQRKLHMIAINAKDFQLAKKRAQKKHLNRSTNLNLNV